MPVAHVDIEARAAADKDATTANNVAAVPCTVIASTTASTTTAIATSEWVHWKTGKYISLNIHIKNFECIIIEIACTGV